MAAIKLPRNCTYSPGDWSILSAYWYPVAMSSAVQDKPVAAKLLDQELVLYRTSAGITAAADLCVHRGAPLSMGKLKGDRIACAYHGYCYDHTGRCTEVPAHPGGPIPGKLHLQVFLVQECYGLVWVCLSATPAAEVPAFPEDGDADYQVVHVPPLDWAASAGRQVESFCDVAHFAFVHEGTFAVRDATVPRYEVQATPYGVHADFTSNVGNVTEPTAANQSWRRVYDIHLPFLARLVIDFPASGKQALLNAASPVSARRTRIFSLVARNFDRDNSPGILIAFQQRIYGEDQAVVERQNPEDLPLDLGEEVHVRADLTSVTYRRQLGALGLGHSFTA